MESSEHSACLSREMFVYGYVDAMAERGLCKSAQAQPGGGMGISALMKAIYNGGKAAVGMGSGALKGIKGLISTIPGLGLTGLGVGALGAIGYNAVKDEFTERDPKEKMISKIESMYANRARELADAKWMDKVRGMRDDLKRNYKKMSVEEYSKKYQELVDALDERKS